MAHSGLKGHTAERHWRRRTGQRHTLWSSLGLKGHLAERHWRPISVDVYGFHDLAGPKGHTAERHWRLHTLRVDATSPKVGRPQRPHSRKALETQSGRSGGHSGHGLGLRAHTAERHWRRLNVRHKLFGQLSGLKGHTAERHWRLTEHPVFRLPRVTASKATQPKGIGDLSQSRFCGVGRREASKATQPKGIGDVNSILIIVSFRYGLKGHTAERHWRPLFVKGGAREFVERPQRPPSRKAFETLSSQHRYRCRSFSAPKATQPKGIGDLNCQVARSIPANLGPQRPHSRKALETRV